MAEWPVVSFVEDSDQQTISIEGGENPIQLSKGDCISFNNGDPDQTFRGKITAFGHDGPRVNRIFYKPWVQDPATGDWKWHRGMDSSIALVQSRMYESSGDWKTVKTIPCPDVVAVGGGKRKQRKTRHRRTRRRRMSRRKN